jgi:mycofactocin precursor
MEEKGMDRGQKKTTEKFDDGEGPAILEEIEIEDLFIDGICGVY